jgi:hypothetical protein
MTRPFHTAVNVRARTQKCRDKLSPFQIISILFLLGLGAFSAEAAADLRVQARTLRSQSLQFVVQGLPMGAAPIQNVATSQVAYIRVDPALLAVSCERIKQSLLNELAARDEWSGIIFVNLHPVQRFDEPIDITTIHHRNSWSYRVDMPDQVERTRLIRAVVQVLMQEIANRGAKSRSAELPQWLLEGMTAHLQATTSSTLVLEPATLAEDPAVPGRLVPITSLIKQRERYADPAKQVREILKDRPPLTFNELSWPAEEQLAGPQADVYRACSQLFVAELLRLKNGRAQLREFFRLLPEYLNWQTAFLHAFQGQFERLLDADKWWALNVAQLTSRDMMVTWNYEEAFRQMDDALAVTAEVRIKPRELPMNAQVKLQQMLLEWPIHRQSPILLQKINILQGLRLRAPQELIGLADNYRLTLEMILKDRQARGQGPFGSNSKDKALVENAIKRLDELDAQRDGLRYLTNSRPPQLSSTPLDGTAPIVNPRDNKP